MSITIKELAELSGYSPATISRVITNKGNVKEETRLEIQKLLTKYHYKTNLEGIGKSAYRERTILVLIGDMSNLFYQEQITRLSETIREKNYICMIGYTGDSIQAEESYVEIAVQEGYAGLIFMNVRGGERIAEMINESGIPVLFLNRTIPHESFDSVCSDNYRGGYVATRYLIERGHRRIGHLAGSSYSHTARERVRGYEDAMEEHGLVVSPNSICYGNLDRSSGYRFGETIVKKGLGYTAVFCGNDLMADGLVRAFREYGVRVPEDVSIICYDNTVISRDLDLTVVSSNPQKMGERAAEVLLNKIKDKEADRQSILFSPVIIPGNSVLPRKEI